MDSVDSGSNPLKVSVAITVTDSSTLSFKTNRATSKKTLNYPSNPFNHTCRLTTYGNWKVKSKRARQHLTEYRVLKQFKNQITQPPVHRNAFNLNRFRPNLWRAEKLTVTQLVTVPC
ncbi:hypothetical protein CDAR_551921 [Caerostris darwini]|uniref:Uncharacterized protein n=1 Tax=Caerostris darwini TaxID=1538125 RepID=A0AAV4V6C1_9ARAC|nr:hypothetical protein CDAR_551921 [Caerostris darwini]